MIKADAIEAGATRMSFDELLLGDDGPFNPAQYIRFWLEQAKELPEADNDFFTYQPAMDVEGQYAFCHSLYGKRDQNQCGRRQSPRLRTTFDTAD